MAKPAAKLIQEKKGNFRTSSLGRAFADARILAHESVFDEMVEYTQILRDFAETCEKGDEAKLQEMINKLAKLPEFLAKKDEEGKSVYETVTQEMSPVQKWSFERNLTETCENLNIYLDMEKITGKPHMIVVDGKEYTKQTFREKMYQNHWTEGADDLAIDRIFEGYYASMQEAPTFTKRNLEPRLKKILDIPVPPDRQNGYKYEAMKSVAGKTTDIGGYGARLNEVCMMYTAKAKKETHEVDKADYLKKAAQNGWDYAEDEAFLSAAYDLRFENGVYKKDIDSALDRLIYWNVVPRKEDQSYDGMMQREESLRKFQEFLKKVPEAEQSAALKKTLEETQKQIDHCEHIREAYKYADRVNEKGFWHIARNRNLLRDMYLAAEGLGEDHPYVQQLKLIEEGKSVAYPQFDLVEDGRGVMFSIQTEAEFLKAAELLQQSGIHTPAAGKAIESINSWMGTMRENNNYTYQKKYYEGWLEWAGVTPEQKKNLKDFAEVLEKEIGNAGLPKEDRKQMEQLQKWAKDAANYNRQPNWHEAQNGPMGIQQLKEVLPGLIGSKGAHHKLYDSAMKVLTDFLPDQAENVRKTAEQTTKDYKAQLELSEEERVAAQQKLLQQQMDSFEKDLAGFKMMKENLDKVKKSYFRHDNSSLYTNMVNKVNDLCAATGYHEMEQLKAELKQLTTDYLDHTTLKRASSVHPNAETRRLCAFQMLAMTDEETYNKYSTDANKLRDKDNQITKERLASIPGVGQPLRNKTSINEMMAQDAPAKKEHKSHAALQPTGPVADTKITKKV